MKKSNKGKKNRKANHYNGRNVYGQRCIAKTVVLEKDTALEQCLDFLDDIEAYKRTNKNVEYTITAPGFTKEELDELYSSIERIMAFRAKMTGTNFLTGKVKTA